MSAPSWDPEIPTGCAAGLSVLSREAAGTAQWEVVGLGEASERPGGWQSRGSTDEEQGYHHPVHAPVDGEAFPREDKVPT